MPYQRDGEIVRTYDSSRYRHWLTAFAIGHVLIRLFLAS